MPTPILKSNIGVLVALVKTRMLTLRGETTVQDVDVVTVEAIIAPASALRLPYRLTNHSRLGDIIITIDQDPDHLGEMTLREN